MELRPILAHISFALYLGLLTTVLLELPAIAATKRHNDLATSWQELR